MRVEYMDKSERAVFDAEINDQPVVRPPEVSRHYDELPPERGATDLMKVMLAGR